MEDKKKKQTFPKITKKRKQTFPKITKKRKINILNYYFKSNNSSFSLKYTETNRFYNINKR